MDVSQDSFVSEIQILPQELQDQGVPVWFKRRQEVMKKGETTVYAYLLLLGDMAVLNEFEDGNHYSFAHLHAGRYLGDLEVLSGQEINAATVIAVQDSFALRFPVESFKKCLAEDIKFLRTVVQGMAAAMFQTSSQQGHNHYRQGVDKLTRFLLEYYELHESETGSQEVVVAQTRQDIASEIGVNIKTVERSVKALREEGILHVDRGKIVLGPAAYSKLLDRSKDRLTGGAERIR